MNWCKECGRWVCTSHECDPEWRCWRLEDSYGVLDSIKVRAVDAQSAAEKWAEYDDESSSEYGIVSNPGDETEVSVCSEISYQSAPIVDEYPMVPPEQIGVFMVRGESVPTYYAREIEGES